MCVCVLRRWEPWCWRRCWRLTVRYLHAPPLTPPLRTHHRIPPIRALSSRTRDAVLKNWVSYCFYFWAHWTAVSFSGFSEILHRDFMNDIHSLAARMNSAQDESPAPAPLLPCVADELSRVCVRLNMGPPEFTFLRNRQVGVNVHKLTQFQHILIYSPCLL